MGTLLDAETRRLYSWWWDSHVGPKNSKWLQENLSDMDAKVKMMMKLIEEDGDSFARRAEMYYKKRPELIKLVDDFYQAYRALAGRYDHATGALRHAHRAMAEAFPNQDSSALAEEDSLTSFPMEEMVPPTIQAPHLIEPGDLNKDASGLSSFQFHAFKRTSLNSDEYDFMTSRKGLKELNDLLVSGESAHHHVQFAPHHLKYETQNELRTDLNPSPREQAHEAESDARNLEEALARLKGEKEANLLEYHKCLEIIHDLEMKISGANRAETEVQILKQTIANLEKEKGEITLQHQKCLETICCLENEVSQAQEEARRLSSVIVMEVAKLSSAEEQYIFLKRQTQSLQNEIDNLTETVEIQTRELLDRHEEIQRLRTGLQEEHMHFMQAQNALRALQNGVQTVKEKDLRIQDLREEFKRVKVENNCLKEQNLSSSMLVKNLNDELFCLKEMKSKLEQEVEVHVSQISSLQQDVYNLKEQYEELNQRHQVIIEQVESVGLKPDCLESSLKNLQNENLMLKEICQKNKEEEETILSEKYMNMEKLLEINVLSEDFLSYVNLKLDDLRGKVKALEETCQALLGEKWGLAFEKDILACQLELTCENVKKISEQNTVLENSLLDANSKVESLKVQSKSAEESCQSLEYEKCGLLKERDSLVSELGSTQKRLEDLKATYIEFEEKHLILVKEKELKTHQVEELQESLDLGKQELANFMQLSETQLAHLNGEIHIVQEECQEGKEALEGVQDKAAKLEIEAFVLHKCMQDIGEKNQALLKEYQKHSEKSELLQILNLKLEQERLEQRAEGKSLLNQVEKLRLGMHQLFKLLNVGSESKYKEKVAEDETFIQCCVQKIEEMGASSLELEDEKLQLLLERSIFITLLREMRAQAVDLESQKKALHRELQTKNEELMIFQSEKDGLRKQNDQLFSNMIKLHQEIEEHKAREGNLVSQLQGKENEIKIWEDEAVELFGDCQVASACQLLFEKKVLELIEVCDFLDVERTAKLIDSEQVKERKYALECENEELKSNLAAFLSLTISLRDKVSSFENCLLPQNEMHETGEQEKEVDGVHGKNLFPTVADGVLDLKELHTRIEAIESAVFEMKSLMTLETVDSKVKLEAALEEIQKLSENGLAQAKPISASKDKSAGLNLHKVIPEISDMKDGIFVKDIPLDQVSNCSSYDRGIDLHIMVQTGVDEPAHESWGGGIQQACNHDLPPHEVPELALEVVPGNEYSSLELQAEKELLVDKLEISKEVIGASAEGSKNILERLGSDAEKLRSIEATFLELRKKVEHHEKDRKTKNFDYRNVKWQLKEIESSIKQLSDVNAVLVKNAKAESLLYDGVEGRKMQRPSVLDQAQRWSEKIGQLQLDLKRIQFLVLKLDANDNDKGKRTRNGDRKVLLRDYLYGNRERSHRKKKSIFFTCVTPLDQSD